MDTATPERTAQDMDFYGVSKRDRRHVQDILDAMADNGGNMVRIDRDGATVLDNDSRPVLADYIPLRSRKFLIDKRGRVWRYRPKGASKDRRRPRQGVPARFNGVEMWMGPWRRCNDPETGLPTYAKKTAWVSLEAGTEVPEHGDPIGYRMQRRGYKHPLDPPHDPTDAQLAEMSEKLLVVEGVVYAMTKAMLKAHGAKPGQATAIARNVVDADPGMAAAHKAAAEAAKAAAAKAAKPKRKYKKRKKTAKRTRRGARPKPAETPDAAEPQES